MLAAFVTPRVCAGFLYNGCSSVGKSLDCYISEIKDRVSYAKEETEETIFKLEFENAIWAIYYILNIKGSF